MEGKLHCKSYFPQRERLCILWGNPIIFTDCWKNPMLFEFINQAKKCFEIQAVHSTFGAQGKIFIPL